MQIQVRYDAGEYHVFPQAKVSEQEILRALVTAVFEVSPSYGLMGIKLSPSEADEYFVFDNGDRSCPPFLIADLDYIHGRPCKAGILKHNDGSLTVRFAISSGRQRSDTLDVIQRAQEILDGITFYTRVVLDSRAEIYGFHRNNGESDWDFRRRIFPSLFAREPERGLEILFGRRSVFWQESEKTMATFVLAKHARHESLVQFADGFADDPLHEHAPSMPAPLAAQ